MCMLYKRFPERSVVIKQRSILWVGFGNFASTTNTTVNDEPRRSKRLRISALYISALSHTEASHVAIVSHDIPRPRCVPPELKVVSTKRRIIHRNGRRERTPLARGGIVRSEDVVFCRYWLVARLPGIAN